MAHFRFHIEPHKFQQNSSPSYNEIAKWGCVDMWILNTITQNVRVASKRLYCSQIVMFSLHHIILISFPLTLSQPPPKRNVHTNNDLLFIYTRHTNFLIDNMRINSNIMYIGKPRAERWYRFIYLLERFRCVRLAISRAYSSQPF